MKVAPCSPPISTGSRAIYPIANYVAFGIALIALVTQVIALAISAYFPLKPTWWIARWSLRTAAQELARRTLDTRINLADMRIANARERMVQGTLTGWIRQRLR